ncbi:MAG: hypothetical protein RLZZ179_1808 [Verrucomicrobiota bacterium]|jgi:hypothetical protein
MPESTHAPETYALTAFMLRAVWAGMLAGVLSGAIIGLFFAREDFMGGYQSWRRRLTRLGHISFFGLALVNATFAFTNHAVRLDPGMAQLAGWSFICGAVTMPLCCFLAAWKQPLRHLFPIPVISVSAGILLTLAAWN